MKITTKYVLREHLGPFLFAVTALTSLMLLQYIGKRLGDLVGRGLPLHVIGEVFLLSLPFTVEMTLPMGVLVAVLYAFSRLASENEITAMRASGMSMGRLVRPVLAAGCVMSFIMLLFNDQVESRANHALAVLQSDIGRTKPSFVLKEQVINTVVDQKLYLRASTIDHASSRMKDVVIYDLSDPAHRRTIYADSGTLAIAANQTDLLMQLYHGVMQEVPTAHPEQLTRLYYKRQQLRMRNVTNSFQASNADSASKSDREMTVCEMQRALSDADYRYQQALYDRLNAQADILVAAGQHNVQRPNRPVKRNPLGLGSIYCGVVQRLFGVKVAQAAELPAHARFALADTGAVTVKDTVHAAPQGVVKDTAHAQPAGPPPSASPTPTPAGTLPGTTPVIQPPVPSSGLVNQPLAPMAQLRGTQEAALAREKLEGFQRIRYDIEIQKKFSLAAACIIFVLLGPPIALRFPRGGVGLVIGVSFVVFALYYVGLIGGESLANSGLIAPVWAMWGDNVLLLLIGLVLTTRMNRVVGATRGGDWSELRATLRQAARRVLHPFARGAE